MHTASTLARVTALAVGIAGVLAVGHVHAAAFQLKENSAKGLGRAFAGSGSAEGDASIIAVNPAGMRQLDGTLIQGDLSAISFSAKFKGTGRNGAGQPQTGGDGGDAGMIAPVPAAYFHMPIALCALDHGKDLLLEKPIAPTIKEVDKLIERAFDTDRTMGFTIGGPIVKDKLGLRVAFYSEHQGGYIDNVAGTYQMPFDGKVGQAGKLPTGNPLLVIRALESCSGVANCTGSGYAAQVIRCESRDGRQRFCRVPGGLREANIERRLSRAGCDYGRSWGFRRDGVFASVRQCGESIGDQFAF